MENKQTAVDYLYMLMHQIGSANDENNLKIYNKAKEMEKEQIKDAFTDGCIGELYELNAYYTSEKYYNKTYGTNLPS
jgi:hypothetical protein